MGWTKLSDFCHKLIPCNFPIFRCTFNLWKDTKGITEMNLHLTLIIQFWHPLNSWNVNLALYHLSFKEVTCTANLFTAKTAGFHCVRFLTVVPMHFLQSFSVCSGSLQMSGRVGKAWIFCSLITAVSKVRFLFLWGLSLEFMLSNSSIFWSLNTSFFWS